MAAAAPSSSSSSPDPKDSMLIVSGGEGYIDFRIGKLFFALLLLFIKPNKSNVFSMVASVKVNYIYFVFDFLIFDLFFSFFF